MAKSTKGLPTSIFARVTREVIEENRQTAAPEPEIAPAAPPEEQPVQELQPAVDPTPAETASAPELAPQVVIAVEEDAVAPSGDAQVPFVEGVPIPREAKPVKERRGKVRLCLYMPEDLMDTTRDIIYYTPGMDLTKFTIRAFQLLNEQMEKERGVQFPHRPKAEE